RQSIKTWAPRAGAWPRIAAFLARLCQWDQRAVAPEEAGGHRNPFRLLTGGIQIELLYLADVLAVGADNGSAYEVLWVADTHERCSSVPDGTLLGRRFRRSPSRGLGPLYGDWLQRWATDCATVAQQMGELDQSSIVSLKCSDAVYI